MSNVDFQFLAFLMQLISSIFEKAGNYITITAFPKKRIIKELLYFCPTWEFLIVKSTFECWQNVQCPKNTLLILETIRRPYKCCMDKSFN